MIICKNCGVELEEDMSHCPLCGQPVHSGDNGPAPASALQAPIPYARTMTAPQKKFTWEIVSLILLSAMAATFIIDFILNKKITWSEYPAAVSLIIFSYVSLFAFWQQRTIIQMLAGFILSSACIIAIDSVTGGVNWAFALGVPVLLAANVVIIVLVVIVRSSKYKGINLLAWAFLGAAVLCICIDGILSHYQSKTIHLTWSIIVGGGCIPVTLVLLFAHFRLKKGRSLKKTFHV